MNGYALFQQVQVELADYIINLSDFDVQKEIGKGANGIVYLATSRMTGELVAIKESKHQQLDECQLVLFCQEIQVLSICHYPFLLSFIGFTNCFPYSIVTKHITKGSIWNALHHDDPLSGDNKNKIAIGIAAGMAELHRHNIIHGDLKSLNVLLDDDYMPVICDFGMSKILEFENETIALAKNVGTPAWMAPELFSNGEISNKSDVYSFGILLWELETSNIPFKGVKPDQLSDMVVNKQERPLIPSNSPVELKRFIRLCWHPNPEKRPSFQTILNKFLEKKVFFEGAKDETINKLKEIIEVANESSIPTTQNVIDYILSVFRELEPNKIINFGKWLNEDNCISFYQAISIMIDSETPSKTLSVALFELLKLITNNNECLLKYFESGGFNKLPFMVPELRDISLSILIPIFESYKFDIDINLLYILETLIQSNPLKIARLFSLLIGLNFDKAKLPKISQINIKVVDLMIMKGDLFIQNGAACALLQSLYKIILINPEILESRGKYCCNIFNQCLESNDDEVIDLAFSILNSLKLQDIVISTDILIRYIKENGSKMNQVLKYLAVTNVSFINYELMELILKKLRISDWIAIVYLKLCHNCTFDISFIKYFDEVAIDKTIPYEYRIRIILSLLSNSSFKSNVSKLNNLISLLNDILYINTLEPIKIIKTIFSKIDINEQLNKLKKYDLINNTFKLAIKINDDNTFLYIYDIINTINKFVFMDEFLLIIPIALKHLGRDSNYQSNSLKYFYLISCNKKSNKMLLKSQLLNRLKELLLSLNDENVKLIQKIMFNIELYKNNID